MTDEKDQFVDDLESVERIRPLPFVPHTTFTVCNCCFPVSKLGQRSSATGAKGMGPVLFPVLSKGMATCPVEQGPGGTVGRCRAKAVPEKITPGTLSWQGVLVWLQTKLLAPKGELRADPFSFN